MAEVKKDKGAGVVNEGRASDVQVCKMLAHASRESWRRRSLKGRAHGRQERRKKRRVSGM